jgi:hypothetical protein
MKQQELEWIAVLNMRKYLTMMVQKSEEWGAAWQSQQHSSSDVLKRLDQEPDHPNPLR